MGRLCDLHSTGVSIWLDTLSRALLTSGDFASLIEHSCITGATSNPTIFEKAIRGADGYEEQLRASVAAGEHEPEALFFALALDDVGRAADLLRPAHAASGGRDGFASFECTPDLADDASGTIEQALALWHRLARPNVMIKVPGTPAGLKAIRELTTDGVNVNVTLLFARSRYQEVIEAYWAGLEQRVAAGKPIDQIASVASFFVSRIDAKVDTQLPGDSPLRGRVAIANAKLAYQLYQHAHNDQRWRDLEDRGGRSQRPLWASTGTKNPEYSDVLYVEELIGADVINTMPEATLQAFDDHGQIRRTIDQATTEAQAVLDELETAGINLDAITATLEREGVSSFCASYRNLLDCIEEQVASAA